MDGSIGPFAAFVASEIDQGSRAGDEINESALVYWGLHAQAWDAPLSLAELIGCCKRAQDAANL